MSAIRGILGLPVPPASLSLPDGYLSNEPASMGSVTPVM
jgi:hypothetical protein